MESFCLGSSTSLPLLQLSCLQDVDEIVVHYPSMFELMRDLKGN